MKNVAIWKGTSKNGEYLSLKGDNVDLIAYKNRFKKTEKQPDYRLYDPSQRDEKGRMVEVGVIWIGKTKNGNEKLTIKTDEGTFVAVANKSKNPKAPAYRMIGQDAPTQEEEPMQEENTSEETPEVEVPVINFAKAAIWKRKSQKGNEVLTIKTQDGKLLNAIPNQFKEKENQPDYRIVDFSQTDEEGRPLAVGAMWRSQTKKKAPCLKILNAAREYFTAMNSRTKGEKAPDMVVMG